MNFQALLYNRDEDVVGARTFHSDDDDHAVRSVADLDHPYGWEIWQRDRLVARREAPPEA